MKNSFTFGNAKSCCLLRTPVQGTYILLWSTLGYHLIGLIYGIVMVDSETVFWSALVYAVIAAVCVPGLLRLTTQPTFLLPFVVYRILVVILDLLLIYSMRHTVPMALVCTCDFFADLHFADVVFTCYKRLTRGSPIKYSQIPLMNDENDIESKGHNSFLNHEYVYTA